VFVPLMTPAIFMMGLGPLARWKEASLPDIAIRLKWALFVSLATALVLLLLAGLGVAFGEAWSTSRL
jgi:cytochrome c-type biogenesis protein CcmF